MRFLAPILFGRRGRRGISNWIAPPVVGGTPVDMLIQVGSGTIGDVVTLARMAAVTVNQVGTWALSDMGDGETALTHMKISNRGFTRRTALTCAGVDYRVGGTRGLTFDIDQAIAGGHHPEGVAIHLPPGINSLSVTALMIFNARGTVTEDFALDCFNISSGAFVVMQNKISAGDVFIDADSAGILCAHGQLVGGASAFGGPIYIKRETLYCITLRHNAATGKAELMVSDGVTGALVGVSHCDSNASEVTIVTIHDYLRFSSGAIFYDLIGFDWTHAAFPLETVTIPAPINLAAVQAELGKINLTWEGIPLIGTAYKNAMGFDYKIERNAAGAGWVTLAAAYDGYSYQDSAVSDGVSYQYRITANVLAMHSAPCAAQTCVLNNGAFAETAFLTAFTGGFDGNPSGQVGIKFTVGAAALTITQLGQRRTPGQWFNDFVMIYAADGVTLLREVEIPYTDVANGETCWRAITPLLVPAGAVRHLRVGDHTYNSACAQVSSGLGSLWPTSVATINDFSDATGSNAGSLAADINFKYTL